MQSKKLTFSEWLESEDGYEMANGQLATVRLLNANKHDGNCTKQAHTCGLCCLEMMLQEYREHFFNLEVENDD
jgi:hypothetical protein